MFIVLNIYFSLTDGISENNPRVIDDGRARKLASDLKRCSYYETCATYGLNVERVFHDGKLKPLKLMCCEYICDFFIVPKMEIENSPWRHEISL